METIMIKPLSVNEYQGENKKPWILHKYKRDLSFLFPKHLAIPKGKKELNLLFGFSSEASDTDNPIKPFIDAMAGFYGFNDKSIKRIVAESMVVPRGSEFISFELFDYCPYKCVHYFRIKNKEYCVAAKMPMGCGDVQYFAFMKYRSIWKNISIGLVPTHEMNILKENLKRKLIAAVV